MSLTLKENLVRNFSRYARRYDEYADIQRQAGEELISCIVKDDLRDILEIGCGTGEYTRLLSERFNNAEITALDISSEMVKIAKTKLAGKNIRFEVGDGETCSSGRKFGLITSNACFHWFRGLEKAMNSFKSRLEKEGMVIFSIFGRETLRELDLSLREAVKDSAIAANGFFTREALEDMLRDNFSRVKVREANYQKQFSSFNELLCGIKYTGTRGQGLKEKSFLAAGKLKKAEACYLDKFKEIKASYQVFFCECSSVGEV